MQPSWIDWVGRRSAAVGTMLRFAKFVSGRAAAPERRVHTILVATAISANLVLIWVGALDPWFLLPSLLITGAVFIVLLISYTRFRITEIRAELEALGSAAAASVREQQSLTENEWRTRVAAIEEGLRETDARQAQLIASAVDTIGQRVTIVETLAGDASGKQRDLARELSDLAAATHIIKAESSGARLALSDVRVELAHTQNVVEGSRLAQTELFARTERLRSQLEQGLLNISRVVAGLERTSKALADNIERSTAETATLRAELDDVLGGVRRDLAEDIARLGDSTRTDTAGLSDRMSLAEGLLGQLRVADAAIESTLSTLRQDLADAQNGLIELESNIGRIDSQAAADVSGLVTRTEELEGQIQVVSAEFRASLEKEQLVRQTALSVYEERLGGQEQSFEQQLLELRGILDRRMGPEFEERLEAWYQRLDNTIGAALQEGRSQDEAENLQRELRLREELKALQASLDRIRESVRASESRLIEEVSELQGKVASSAQAEADLARQFDAVRNASADQVRELSDSVAAQLDAHSLRLDEVIGRMGALGTAYEADRGTLQAAMAAAQDAHNASGEDAALLREDLIAKLNALEDRLETLDGEAIDTDASRHVTTSSALVRPFSRVLSPEDLHRLETHWLKALGINMSRSALAYMAHKACLLEDAGNGRIAAPIETIMLRLLALRSLPPRPIIEVMEIGTLFGLGAAVLYKLRGPRAPNVHLTLVDPLSGYYEASDNDPVTGVPISEDVVRQNLAVAGVPSDSFRIITARSNEEAAIRTAQDRAYDYVLLDGDHSTAGVASDFQLYGPMVRPGGIIVFDDYGASEWPGIQPFVDSVVRSDPDWVWIGAEYRTAIVARRGSAA